MISEHYNERDLSSSVENFLRENANIVITEHGISPTLLLGSLPVNVSAAGNGNGKGVRLVKDEQ